MELYGYQKPCPPQLASVIRCNGAAINGSDPGTGKTVVAVETMKQLDEPPTLVVCPKAVMPAWHRTAAAQKTELDVINYEMLRTGKTPYGIWRDDGRFSFNKQIGFLILDEAHRCKGFDSQTSQFMRGARRCGIRTLAMSATLADTPMEMDALGYLLGFHDGTEPTKASLKNLNPVSFYDWARQYGCHNRDKQLFDFYGTGEEKRKHMAAIHSLLYPHKGCRIRIKDLGDLFPESQITAELYDFGNEDQVNALYQQMAEAREKLHARTDNYRGGAFTELLAERQEVELLKVPGIVELTKDSVAQGASVALFVNFRQTIEELCKRLDTRCFIDGSQVGERGAIERENNRRRFQEDAERIIVCNCEAGGVGLDLHDLRGEFPRHTYIAPVFSAKTARQIVGRVQRAGGARTKSLQRFLFAAGTVEEPIHRTLAAKLDNLDALNDGDLWPKNLRFS